MATSDLIRCAGCNTWQHKQATCPKCGRILSVEARLRAEERERAAEAKRLAREARYEERCKELNERAEREAKREEERWKRIEEERKKEEARARAKADRDARAEREMREKAERAAKREEERKEKERAKAERARDRTLRAEEKARKAAAAAKKAAEEAEKAKIITGEHWAKARAALRIGGRVRAQTEDGAEQRLCVLINGNAYADGDLISFNHGINRFTWRVTGLGEGGKLELMRIKARNLDGKAVTAAKKTADGKTGTGERK